MPLDISLVEFFKKSKQQHIGSLDLLLCFYDQEWRYVLTFKQQKHQLVSDKNNTMAG